MGKTSSAMAAASRIDAILERDASNPDTMETSQPTHADVTTPIERVSVRALVASGTPRLRGRMPSTSAISRKPPIHCLPLWCADGTCKSSTATIGFGRRYLKDTTT